MGDRKRQTIILSLINKMHDKRSWCGETHMQKSVYFLEEFLGVPFGFEFVLYKHGPFSFDLRDELEEMRAYNFLALKSNYPYGPSYVSGELAISLMEYFPKTYRAYEKQLDFIAENVSPKSVSELERLATAHFINKEKPAASVSEKADYMIYLKPHIKRHDAEEAFGQIEDLIAKSKEIAA